MGPTSHLDPPTLRLRNISKSFGNFRALDSVDFEAHRGEVMALLGANGSGKSTLVKLLAGYHAPDPGGEALLRGRPIRLPIQPVESRRLGMSFVFQNLGLAPNLTVLENLMLGIRASRSTRDRSYINWRREARQAKEILTGYGVDLDPNALICDVAPVGRALLAIARAAEEQRIFGAESDESDSVLVLDEPTVFLPESDCEFLYDLVRNITKKGASVIFISHDLDAVRKLADSVTVLRNGRVAGKSHVDDISDDDLIELIVGSRQGESAPIAAPRPTLVTKPAGRGPEHASDERGVPQLRVRGLRGGRVKGLGFELRRGEILGLAGLIGSGLEEVPYQLFGATKVAEGTIAVKGVEISLPKLTPAKAIERGIALVPSDRAEQAGVATIPVEENMLLLVEHDYYRAGWRRRREIRRTAAQRCAGFDVRPRDPEIAFGSLSGGNQQKVVLAKWLETEPAVIVLHEPTQGVDVGARADLYRLVQETIARTGACVVWVTTDFAELATVCDRVLVVRDGRIGDELSGSTMTREAISTAVFGAPSPAADPMRPGGNPDRPEPYESLRVEG